MFDIILMDKFYLNNKKKVNLCFIFSVVFNKFVFT